MTDPREPILGSAPFARRTVLKAAAGVAGVAAAGPLLAACGSSSSSGESASASASGSASEGGATGTVTFGSNASDAVPKQAYADALSQFEAFNPNVTVSVNTVDHNTFQEQINSYLQGSPDQVFTWFAGYRMQFFAAQGLATEINSVWETIGPDFNDAFKQASTYDGSQYFVPFYYYPWAIFYRKSVFKDLGIDVASLTTMDALTAAAGKMKDKGLVPLAFADKDGWPAMGTFDQLNFRLNGYDFHMSLMAGNESWTDPKVKAVFTAWADQLLPISQPGALGRTWQEAAQALLQKKAGMYLLGMFVGQQFPEGADRDDLDFFSFPEMNPDYGQDTVEAPIDGFMMSASTENPEGGKELLTYLGGPEAITIYLKSDPNNVAANNKASTADYNALQKKAAEMVGGAAHITQFLDRDTRPDFASTVIIPALQSFIDNPADIDSILEQVEKQKQAIFAT